MTEVRKNERPIQRKESRQKPTIRLSVQNEPELVPVPVRRTGFIVGIIILAIVVVILIVIVIILLLRKTSAATVQCTTNADCTGGKLCSNNVCVLCIGAPPTPKTVTITSNITAGSATVNWVASAGAISYNVYRKLADPSVGVNNYDQVVKTTNTNQTFTSLPSGTSYFVVTAVNSCGESPVSEPVVLASYCPLLPATMPPPVVTETNNDCAGSTQVETISVSFINMNIPNGVYVIQGTDQAGSVSSYLYIIQGSSFGPAIGISQKCGSISSTHTVTQISTVENATVTNTGGPFTAGSSFTVTWDRIAGAEQYLVFLVGTAPVTAVPHYYGGYAPASANSLSLQTTPGDNLLFAMVLGFNTCNMSQTSAATTHVSPA